MNLYFLLFVVSFLSLVYELLLSTQGSYLIGSSVVVFSLTIGFYLLGLGIGSYFGALFKQPKKTFFLLEIILGFLGGCSVFLLKQAYMGFGEYHMLYWSFFLVLVTIVGTCTGCEPPLIANIINTTHNTKHKIHHLFGQLLSIDYLGSLIGTLLFPFLLLPMLGIEYTTLLLGGINIVIALFFGYRHLGGTYPRIGRASLVGYIVIVGGYYQLHHLTRNKSYFVDPVIYETQSTYQKIHITQGHNHTRLYLDGNIQFDSRDHHRYHQSLLEVVKLYDRPQASVLILGGGDGLLADATHAMLTTMDVDYTTDLVELDPAMIDLARNHPTINSLNHNILDNNLVTIHTTDAFGYVRDSLTQGHTYDIVIADFPDPRTTELSILYSEEFYDAVQQILSPEGGVFVTQASNAYATGKVFGCIHSTIQSTWQSLGGYHIIPYHTFVPARGDWGFVAVYPSHRGTPSMHYGSLSFDEDYITEYVCDNNSNYNELPLLYQQGWKK